MYTEIVEIGAIRSLVDSGQLVIACGGGGIPVTRQGNHLKGASAVIDKDFASELLAENLNADFLIILTAAEKVAINFGKPEEKLGGTYDCIAIMCFYDVCRDVVTFREMEEIEGLQPPHS